MAKVMSPEVVAKIYGVSRGTVIGWCRSGALQAVDVSGEGAKRRRWRITEDNIAAFEAKRANTTPAK